ncbi:hypothetical protein [Streptomyces sp. KMM 9044]|uniref:hypothetical protein n=1 Tax=Streptomyces sp. KMM 9044 TaxID=2744474 RepID=UPI002150B9E3|nr:hypothetical protein [Streptomyces sp. KMM 9044]WAX76412.1 hypothetical protein HUV60_000610 [Streptomyces sp. KMM 9044]
MKKNSPRAEGPDGLVCTARLPLSSAILNYLAILLRGHLEKIGSPWRALPAGKIAGIVLAVLRCDQRPGDLAGGNGVHRTTVTRWVREVVGLPAARAPRLDRALKKIARKGGGIVLLDGSPIRTRRRTGTDNRTSRQSVFPRAVPLGFRPGSLLVPAWFPSHPPTRVPCRRRTEDRRVRVW